MLCRNFRDIEPRKVKGLHGGAGVAVAREVFADEFQSQVSFLHHTTLLPDAAIGVHPHEGNEEVYVILSGEGDMTVDGETRRVGPGDVVLTRSGSSHGLRNAGRDKLEILVFLATVAAP